MCVWMNIHTLKMCLYKYKGLNKKLWHLVSFTFIDQFFLSSFWIYFSYECGCSWCISFYFFIHRQQARFPNVRRKKRSIILIDMECLHVFNKTCLQEELLPPPPINVGQCYLFVGCKVGEIILLFKVKPSCCPSCQQIHWILFLILSCCCFVFFCVF